VAGDDYPIADIAIVTWAKLWERQGQDIADFPHVRRWLDAVKARPAVLRGFKLRPEPEEVAASA
jgi:GST-like protein